MGISTYTDEMLGMIAQRHLGHQFTTRWVSRSHFSAIICVENGTGKLVIKAIMPWHLEGLPNGERSSTIEMLNAATVEFRHQLAMHAVALSSVYDILTQDGYIYHVSSYAGEPGDAMMLTLNAEHRLQLLHQMLRAIAGVLHQSTPVTVGLDAQLSNFGVVPKSEGEFDVRYLDVFPPLVRYQDQYLVHYPNPTDPVTHERELQRKFSPFGILRRMRFSVMSVDDNLEGAFNASLRDVLDTSVFSEVDERFAKLPDAAINNGFDRSAIRDLIAAIPLEGIDDIREVGMRLARRSSMPREQFLNEVFDLSRIYTSPGYEEPHEVRFEKLRQRLIQLV